MEYELIRTRRKTVAIHIKEGRVIVRAPMRTPVRDIERFIASKQDWIDKHLAVQQARAKKRAGFELAYGSAILFLGREYRIAARSGKTAINDNSAAGNKEAAVGQSQKAGGNVGSAPKPANAQKALVPKKLRQTGVQLSFFEAIGMQADPARPPEGTASQALAEAPPGIGGTAFQAASQALAEAPSIDGDVLYFPPGLDEARLKGRLILFYKQEARKLVTERIGQIAPLMGVKPTNIYIGSAKRSWGSCNAKGRLSFSWRIMMAPPEAVDYVIVHELAHLKHLDHSKAFWAVVAKVLPDWKRRRQLFRLLQKRLDTEDWD